jgi:ABC-type bacteriocin/lantibiotic exporter with double-glycine peptidase domain
MTSPERQRGAAGPSLALGAGVSTAIPMTELIQLEDVRKTYHLGEIDVPVLKGVSLTIGRGEMVALMGASGSASG